MSKTIDQRVVEMRFDNKDFEKNVSTSMSSLDKLKQRLNLTGASKGLENVQNAAKKCDFSPLGNAIQTVQTKFSALEVIGVTALANITNSAVNAGKNIVSALTIDPVMSGFQEYETQINAIQTILANTSHQGTTMDDVTSALDELNHYADQTIYNFTEMTRNIGTFTAAGVDLDTSVGAIKGIANLAAVSGSNAQQASTAMYQLSQALAAGRVTLEDWNSVVNAGMGGKIFQDALKNTAKAMGIAVDESVSFRESLSAVGGKDIWLTSDVLLNTLNQFTGDMTDAELAAMGFTDAQIKNIQSMAATANGAAMDVKTLTQLWDTLKESAQSGWTQTWEIIVGDFDEAKALFTEISNGVGNIINSMSESRNNLLEGAFGSKWDNLIKKINEAGISTEDFEAKLIETAKKSGIAIDDIIEKEGSLANAFKNGKISVSVIVDTIKSFADSLTGASKTTKVATDNLEKFQSVVNKVIRGDFGNGAERVKALTDAGYDQVAVQKLVNKVWERNGKTWKDTTITAEDLSSVIGELSESELESIGYTEEQAKVLKELAKQAEETGTPLNDLINNLNKPSGRELLIDSFRNIFVSLYNAIVAVKDAWTNIFPPMQSEQLYSILEGFHNLTVQFKFTEEDAKKLRRTFEGLFAIVDLVSTVIGGAFKIAFQVLKEVLSRFGYDVLDVTAGIGDMLVGFRNFIKENQYIQQAFDFIVDSIVSLVKKLQELYDKFMAMPQVQQAIEFVKTKFEELSSAGKSAIDGLKNGINGGWGSIFETLKQNASGILTTIKEVLGIQSSSSATYEIGFGGIMQGLSDGILGGIKYLLGNLQAVIQTVLDFFTGIDWTPVIATLVSVGLVTMVKKMIDIAEAITAPLAGIGDVLSSVSETIDAFNEALPKLAKSVTKFINAKAFEVRAEAIKTIASAILSLVGAVIVLTLIPAEKLWPAIGALAAIAAVIGVLSASVGLIGPEDTLQLGSLTLAILGLSASLLIISSALKNIASIDNGMLDRAVDVLVGLSAAIPLIAITFGLVTQGISDKAITEFGNIMLKISASFILLSVALKIIATMSIGDLAKGTAVLAGFVGIIALLTLITKLTGEKNIDALGNTLIKMAIAMGLMALVIKIIATISYEDIIKGMATLVGFTGIIALLALVNTIGGGASRNLGATLIAMSASILIMAATVMLLSNISQSDLNRGMSAVLSFAGIIAVLVSIVKLAGNSAPKIALTLLAMSASIAVLATVAVILSFVDLAALAKGVIAVAFLSAIMVGLTVATKYAGESYKTLIVLSAAIAVLAIAVGALSFIDPVRLAAATAALSVLMATFALVVMSSKDVNGSLPVLITMTAAVGVIGGILYLLGTLPAEQAMAAALGISSVLLSLSATMLVLNTIKTISPAAYGALIVLGLIAAGIGLLLSYLVSLPNMELALDVSLALSSLILSLSAACILLGVAGTLAGGALAGIAVLVVAVAAVGALVYEIGKLASENENMTKFLEEGIPIIEKIGTAIGTFFGNLVGGIIGGVSTALPILGTNLSLFMTNLQPFIDGAEDIDADLLTSIGILTQTVLLLTAADFIAGIGKLFGLGNFESLTSSFTSLGEAVVAFSNTVAPNGKSLINEEAVKAAANAGKLLADLNRSLPKEGGVLQKFFGTSMDLATFGEKLKEFGTSIVTFSNTVAPNGESIINEEAVKAAANAGQLLADLNKNLPASDGILQDFLGEKDFSTWGEQIKDFGTAIVTFSNTVAPGGNPLVSEEAVKSAVNAGQLLAELNGNLPSSDGILQSFIGEKDFTVWGKQIKDFGTAIVTFSNTIAPGGKSLIDEEAIKASANAGAALSALHNSLPSEGGILQGILGSKDLSSFGDQVVKFGGDLMSYSMFMKYVDPDIVTNTAAAASSLVTLSDSLGNKEWFVDENTLDEFGGQIKTFGEHFYAYYAEMSKINVGTLSSVISQVYRLVEMSKTIEDLDSTALGSFGKNLKKLGENGIDEFISAFDNCNSRVSSAASSMLENFISAANQKRLSIRTQFSGLAQEALNAIKSKASDFGTAGQTIMLNFSVGIKMKQDLAKTTVKSMIDYILSVISSTFSQFSTYGRTIATKFNSGLSKFSESKKIVNDTLSSMVSSIRSEYSSFYDAGEYLVKGLAQGIEDNKDRALKKARELASAISKATEKALDINSPSKVFMKIGQYVALGLAKGLENGQSSVEVSAIDMANRTIDSMSGTISKIVDAIEGKVDSHPTIRPVLDLSDIEENAAKLNTMFSSEQAMSIGASISSRMNDGELQNGENSVGSRVVNNNFTQNNYSPKALSRIDIYRQSKNLFSTSTRRIQPT